MRRLSWGGDSFVYSLFKFFEEDGWERGGMEEMRMRIGMSVYTYFLAGTRDCTYTLHGALSSYLAFIN